MTQTLNPPGGFSSAYPAPPRVHWLALFLVIAILYLSIWIFIPASRTSLLSPVFLGAWGVYLCLWVRDLNPGSRTIILADAKLAFALIAALVSPFALPSSLLKVLLDLWLIGEFIIYLFLVFGIRNELEKHYNEREPIGLKLGSFMTFFFSFYYFQYHLYRIAKEKHAQSLASLAPSQTPSS
jgi:hypothetical protein